MNGKRTSPAHLNQLRQEAVRMRLEQHTLKEISEQTGLTRPTISAAYKSFIAGGWAAVDTGKRGSPKGSKSAGLSGADEGGLTDELIRTSPDDSPATSPLWSLDALGQWLEQRLGQALTPRTLARYAGRWGFNPSVDSMEEDAIHRWVGERHPEIMARTNSRRTKLLMGGITSIRPEASINSGKGVDKGHMIFARDQRGKVFWLAKPRPIDAVGVRDFFGRLTQTLETDMVLLFKGLDLDDYPDIRQWLENNRKRLTVITIPPADSRESAATVPRTPGAIPATSHQTMSHQTPSQTPLRNAMTLTHLQRLEAESIQIMREVVAETENPVMLYSIGKDSAVMLHLAVKAFSPSVPPFPLLHVDTTWKFQAMYKFRDQMVKDLGMKLITHTNPEGLAQEVNPFTHGSALHTDIMKTEALKQALDKYGFDAAFGGARRDEEKSRAKERIFSFRTAQHRWDPKNQRPELWKLYNTRKHPKESIRVFPLSNWTELDIWQYIHLEQIPIVPLYYAAERPVVERDGALIMVDDKRMPLKSGEVPMMKKVRFRTLGCYPLTGAVESEADTLPAIIQEMLLTNSSERQGRVIDHDSSASMEKKKQEGYF